MVSWLSVAWGAAGLNVALLLLSGSIWLQNYRQHGAQHTLGLLVFAGFLLIENLLWLYFYLLHPAFRGWFLNAGTDIQIGVALLCGLELVALLVLARITWL